MERKNFIRKIIVLLFIVFISGAENNQNNTSANNGGIAEDFNHSLMLENEELKEQISLLANKLNDIENKIASINDYNNLLYTQILGVDYDTSGFYKYRDTTRRLVFSRHDSIFHALNDRSIYAAEILSLQLEKVKETSSLLKKDKNAIRYYPNISPIKTKDFIELTSPYGLRYHPIYKKHLFHEGVDIAAKKGTPIYATAQGRVIEISYSKYGYGNKIVIQHEYGFETLYAHLSSINVKKGQWVKKNQFIGKVGNTGTSTGNHLHYEIKKYNEPRDPLGYFYTHITDEFLAQNN